MLTISVDDPDDPRIEVFIGLRDFQLRRAREGAGGDLAGIFIAEGDLVVERALRAGYRLVSMLVSAKRTRLFDFDYDPAVPLYGASEAVLTRITGFHLHRGVLACFARRPLASVAEVLDGARRVVAVENVNNPTNVGIIARSAGALGIDALVLDDTSCDPLYRRSTRVSMGEVFTLPYAYLGLFPEGLDALTERGFDLLALTPDPAAPSIEDLALAPTERVALVFGAEGPGLTPATLARCHRLARIPMRDGADSLNIAAAAAIAIWCITRR